MQFRSSVELLTSPVESFLTVGILQTCVKYVFVYMFRVCHVYVYVCDDCYFLCFFMPHTCLYRLRYASFPKICQFCKYDEFRIFSFFARQLLVGLVVAVYI